MRRLVLLLSAVLCAVGSPAQAKSPAKRPTTTLTIWIMPNGQGTTPGGFNKVVAPFEAANPGIKVEAKILPWPVALSKIESALHGGPAPDITQLGTTWVAAMASTGRLLDLTGKYDERLFPAAVLATTEIESSENHRGRRFAMPWMVDTRALYYNKEICAKAGVDPQRDFATWASFKAALQKIKATDFGGKSVDPLGVPTSGWDIIHSLSFWIWGAGGDFVARHPGENGIDSPSTLTGIEYYIDLYRSGLVSERVDTGQANADDLLRAGEIATAITQPLPSLSEDHFGVVGVPTGSKGRFTFLGGSALAVLKSSKHQDAAIALLRFLSTEEAQVRHSTLTGMLPAAAAQYDELLLQLDPIRGAFVQQMQFGKAYPSIAVWGSIEEVLRDGLGAVWTIGRKPGPYDRAAVQAQLAKTARRIDEILRSKPNRD
jgi:multiple sugar transport system substrate-binding protein